MAAALGRVQVSMGYQSVGEPARSRPPEPALRHSRGALALRRAVRQAPVGGRSGGAGSTPASSSRSPSLRWARQSATSSAANASALVLGSDGREFEADDLGRRHPASIAKLGRADDPRDARVETGAFRPTRQPGPSARHPRFCLDARAQAAPGQTAPRRAKRKLEPPQGTSRSDGPAFRNVPRGPGSFGSRHSRGRRPAWRQPRRTLLVRLSSVRPSGTRL